MVVNFAFTEAILFFLINGHGPCVLTIALTFVDIQYQTHIQCHCMQSITCVKFMLVFVQSQSLYKFVTLCAPKNLFKANRTGMKRSIKGDEQLDFSDKALERR